MGTRRRVSSTTNAIYAWNDATTSTTRNVSQSEKIRWNAKIN
jgi:hypothetical protein